MRFGALQNINNAEKHIFFYSLIESNAPILQLCTSLQKLLNFLFDLLT